MIEPPRSFSRYGTVCRLDINIRRIALRCTYGHHPEAIPTRGLASLQLKRGWQRADEVLIRTEEHGLGRLLFLTAIGLPCTLPSKGRGMHRGICSRHPYSTHTDIMLRIIRDLHTEECPLRTELHSLYIQAAIISLLQSHPRREVGKSPLLELILSYRAYGLLRSEGHTARPVVIATLP